MNRTSVGVVLVVLGILIALATGFGAVAGDLDPVAQLAVAVIVGLIGALLA